MRISLEKLLRDVQKPARYTGGERGAVYKEKSAVDLRVAFCFPDVYEVGMSHLGSKILYSLLNRTSNVWCERVFAPWYDMRDAMIAADLPLFALESRDAVRDFDVVAFTLQYELSYTNILYMLDLAGIPLLADERDEAHPLVIAGGPCACNPEPLSDFVDLFVLGEGEEVFVELCELLVAAKKENLSRRETLRQAARLAGAYVPSLYTVEYRSGGTIDSVTPLGDAPATVTKRYIKNFNDAPYPSEFVVPMIEVIHDRASVEVLRGCIRGCRFCQAGYIYRPYREKSVTTLDCQARELCRSTGYEELSLLSLSTSDHSAIQTLLDGLLDWTKEDKINLSLPSMRIDRFDDALVEKLSQVRKSGLTFAPEAGTQRLRDVINKNITEEEILSGCKTAFEAGYTAVKLYFMMGLPTETDDDVRGIAALAQKIVDLYYALPDKPKGKSVSVTLSCACFIPKPFTPFEFCAQDTIAEFNRKQMLLKDAIRTKKINYNWHDASAGFMEASLARGDRRLGAVLLDAYRSGSIFDSWDEGFSPARWNAAFEKNGADPAFYANRERQYDEVFPWDHLNYGVSKSFLVREHRRALRGAATPNCREKCASCGIAGYIGGRCFAKR